MNLSQDIHSLTDFKRKTPEFLRQLKETGDPVVLTINGKAELVVQDAASYQRLFELAERLETIEAVKEGLASADRGEGRPMDDVFDAIEKDLLRGQDPSMTYHVVIQLPGRTGYPDSGPLESLASRARWRRPCVGRVISEQRSPR